MNCDHDIQEDEKSCISISERQELERLRDAVRFTMTDHQRLLRKSELKNICPHQELCFEYTDHVRCGPCATKQSEQHGVDTNISLPFSPAEYRLKRAIRATETELGIIRKSMNAVFEAFNSEKNRETALYDTVSNVVENCTKLTNTDFDPSLISISPEGYLVYAGTAIMFSSATDEKKSIYRKVEEWAMENLTALPDQRWRMRQVR